MVRLKHWRYMIPLRLRSLFRRNRVEQELDEELGFHLECRIAEEIAKGSTSLEARRAAIRALDGIELCKEECRDKEIDFNENHMTVDISNCRRAVHKHCHLRHDNKATQIKESDHNKRTERDRKKRCEKAWEILIATREQWYRKR